LPPAATTAAPGSVDSAAASTPNVPTADGGVAPLLAARRLRELVAEMKMLRHSSPVSLRSAIQELAVSGWLEFSCSTPMFMGGLVNDEL